MEALQLLKFRYRSERLNFSEGRLATEEECGTVIDIEPSVFENMLMSGDIDGLQTIIATSHQHTNQ
ncbi:hypothetical protein BDN72DRAFT_851958 [Pluteus cervinus]|uniref:Uncharacterized protein n=1 Tax=Pluteus cervinus TaxID=181527 RepID=A0ACD2ZWD6_9AGAR|nr:hypothetical protein BDN72DRAFT_851958 [Pluteus cervinus]